MPWLPLLWVPFFLAMQTKTQYFQAIDAPIALIFLAFGLILDTLWLYFGFIEYTNNWPIPGLAPIWILILWFGVGFDFRHSLAWVAQRPLIGGAICGASAPMSYFSGQALGLAVIPEWALIPFVASLFITWAIAFPMIGQYILRLEKTPRFQPTENDIL